MGMIIDPTTDTTYRQSVRSLLGVDRDDTVTLPDEDIDDPTILDMAEMHVLSLIDGTTNLSEPKVRLAVIYTMASLLCPSMPGRVEIEVKSLDMGWKKKGINYEELAEKLLGTVTTLVEEFVAEGVGGDSDIFRIAPSKRAVSRDEY